MKRNAQGFTLIEMLIVIAIISILGTIAIQGYRSYIVAARRSAVQQELVKATNILENCYSLNQTYMNCLSSTNNLTDFLASSDSSGYYVDGGSEITQNNFTLRVTATNAQNGDDSACKNLGINRTGRKLSETDYDVHDNNCW
jgi:type IV pilus assembly protein PilE